MKDYTLYDRYETFAKQLDSSIKTKIRDAENLEFFTSHYPSTLKSIDPKSTLLVNECELTLELNNKHAVIYHFCISQFKKQYYVQAVICDDNGRIINTLDYLESTKPNEMNNRAIKDIIAHLQENNDDKV